MPAPPSVAALRVSSGLLIIFAQTVPQRAERQTCSAPPPWYGGFPASMPSAGKTLMIFPAYLPLAAAQGSPATGLPVACADRLSVEDAGVPGDDAFSAAFPPEQATAD